MKSNINLHNYEQFLVDYLDDNLTSDLKKEVDAFLDLHPNIKQEFQSLDEILLISPSVQENYNLKNSLHKSELFDDETFNHACIAFLDNDLSKSERANFNSFLTSNPNKRKDLDLMAKSFLKPQAITYPAKNQLYKSAPTIILFNTLMVAASIALLIGCFSFIANTYKMNQFNGARRQVAILKAKGISIPDNSNPLISQNTEVKSIEVLKAPQKKSHKMGLEHKPTELELSMTKPGIFNYASLKPIQIHLKQTEILFYTDVLEPIEKPEINNNNSSGLFAIVKNLKIFKTYSNKIEEQLPNTTQTASIYNFLSDVTKNKFSYTKNEDGEVKNIAYRGRLLGFNLPTSK